MASSLAIVKFNGSNLTLLGFDAFRGTKITSMIVPSSVHTMRQGVFSQCLFLISVVLPGGLTDVSIGLFEITPLLQEVILHEGITTINSVAFKNSGIKKIIIPSSMTSIHASAFRNTTNLTDITMPNHLKGDGTAKYGLTQVQ
jgi:hypothetical protein